MTNKGVVCAAILAANLSACVWMLPMGQRYPEVMATQPAVSATDARIVFFRTKESSLYWNAPALVSLDGEGGFYIQLPSGGFAVIDVPAGKRVVSPEPRRAKNLCDMSIEVSAGMEYYFEVEPQAATYFAEITSGFGSGLVLAAKEFATGPYCQSRFAIRPIDEGVAQSKLTDLREVKWAPWWE